MYIWFPCVLLVLTVLELVHGDEYCHVHDLQALLVHFRELKTTTNKSVTMLENGMKNLQKKNKKAFKLLDNVTDSISKLDGKVDGILNSMTLFKNEIQDLQKKNQEASKLHDDIKDSIIGIESDIKELQNKNQENTRTHGRIVGSINKLQNKNQENTRTHGRIVGSIKNLDKKLTDELKSVELKTTMLKTQFEELQNKNQENTRTHGRIVGSIKNLDKKLTDELKSVELKTTMLKTQFEASNQHVGFTAYLDHDVSTQGVTIIYDSVLQNEGSAYNPATGVFTCPFNGLYLFSFSVYTRGEHQIWVSLYVNGQKFVQGSADGFHDFHDTQGGGSVVLRLRKRDRVYIKSFGDQPYKINLYSSSRCNMFSGALLYAYG